MWETVYRKGEELRKTKNKVDGYGPAGIPRMNAASYEA
jgi:hypothetical protein